ncbi:toxin-antitoxin system HicB family antitoxin [Streptomyces boncukensis]|uniref:Toxin-antitoxin system HicB family antitoxin n=1 Tax=Streptomyces boncukensis TaxID=2711219 RepID=A0A6G4WTT9_9ACTN|nr:toxin-antitoxin system HicB family antitoxin [Streptomyces boncukensis]NGO68262.1 toxin-antitoxin system HicB family antitoxin [Streptomyces boncukensis]
MDLTPHVDSLRQELVAAARSGAGEAGALAEQLGAALESAARLTLLNALSEAMDEVTRELAPGSVDIRLRGLDPEFVVARTEPAKHVPPMAPLAPPPGQPDPAGTGQDGDAGAIARVNFRIPARLKTRIERAAAEQRLSVNAWLVRAVATTLDTGAPVNGTPRGAPQVKPGRYTGWVR